MPHQFSTLESIATPCSVKSCGSFRRPLRPTFDVTICDIKLPDSAAVSRKEKSAEIGLDYA